MVTCSRNNIIHMPLHSSMALKKKRQKLLHFISFHYANVGSNVLQVSEFTFWVNVFIEGKLTSLGRRSINMS